MKCKEILDWLKEIMPLNLALDWDNVGLLAGSENKEVTKILVALDASSEVIDEAIRVGADLIITHHPMIFSAIKNVSDDNIVGKRLYKIIKNDISYIAMHTNYDIAPGCMGDITAEIMGIEGSPLEITGEISGSSVGIGKVGKLKSAISLTDLCNTIKDKFELPYITVYDNIADRKPIETIAISPGSGKGMKEYALKAKAQVLITGDITHHEGLDANEAGLIIIDAGHFGIEHIFIKNIKQRLIEQYGDKVLVNMAEIIYPARIM